MPAGRLSPGGEEERGILGKIPIPIVEYMETGKVGGGGGVAPISWGQTHLRLFFIINTWRRARGDPQREALAYLFFVFLLYFAACLEAIRA